MSGSYRLNGQAPRLAAEVFVAPGAHLVGQVEIGHASSVWFGAVLHTDPGFALQIGDEVTIGHQAMLHGCCIGAGSLIGSAAADRGGSGPSAPERGALRGEGPPVRHRARTGR